MRSVVSERFFKFWQNLSFYTFYFLLVLLFNLKKFRCMQRNFFMTNNKGYLQ